MRKKKMSKSEKEASRLPSDFDYAWNFALTLFSLGIIKDDEHAIRSMGTIAGRFCLLMERIDGY